MFQLKLSLERVGVDQVAPDGGELSLELGRLELSLELGRELWRGRWCVTSSNSESSSARGGGGGGEARLELSLEHGCLASGRLSCGYCMAGEAGRGVGVEARCSRVDRNISSRRSIRDRLISSVVSWRGTWSSTDCPVPTILASWIRQSGGGPCARLDRWRRCLMPCWSMMWA